jgi:hypothetical protein
MFDKIYDWCAKHAIGLFIFALVVTCIVTILSLVDVVRKPPDLSGIKGVQHRLVWDISGNCFFVRPYNESTNYLIAVPDCNKGK